MHTHMHTCTHAYMHACIHAYMHACTHAYMHNKQKLLPGNVILIDFNPRKKQYLTKNG